jgi:hypothetical protein
MFEYLSHAVLTAVLRVSSSPIFSLHLANASLVTLRLVKGSLSRATALRTARTEEGTNHV